MIKWFYILFLIPAFITGCGDSTGPKKVEDDTVSIPQDIIDQLQGGEIAMRKGDGFLSTQIMETLNEPIPFSHSAIICKKDSQLFIVHSLGRDYSDIDGVQIASLNLFTEEAKKGGVCIVRPKATPEELQRIQDIAIEYTKYNLPFDYGFDLETKDELHCTELIKDVLDSALQRDIFPVEVIDNGMECLMFKNFFNPKNFEVVYTAEPLPALEFEK